MVMLLLLVLAAATSASCHQGHAYNKEGWAAASEYLRETMDDTLDPCEDFWGFMCGKWNQTEELNLRSQHVKNRKTINAEVVEALEKVDLNDSNVPKFKKSLKVFYQKCVTRTKSAEAMVRDIYDSLERYFMPKIALRKNDKGDDVYPWEEDDLSTNGTTLGSTFWNFVGRLQKEQNTYFLLRASLLTVTKGCEKTPMLMISPSFTLGFELEMLTVFFNKIFGSYHNVTVSQQDINDTFNEMMRFEMGLIYLPYHGSIDMNPQPITLDDLVAKVPEIDWYAYMDGLLPEDVKKAWLRGNVTLNVLNLNHFKKIAAFVNKYNRVTVYNAGFAAVIQNYYNLFMKGEFKPIDERQIFNRHKIDDENVCLDFVYRYFTAATIRLLFDDKYNVTVNDWKNDIRLIAQTVLSAFRFLVYSLDWMDNKDKMKVGDKIDKMRFYGDLADWLVDDDAVYRNTPKYDYDLSLVANDMLTQKLLFEEHLKPLVLGFQDDPVPSFIPNAVYYQNNIVVFLGEQLPPSYRYNYPIALKYGHYGWTVGHELLHGFDSGGILEPPAENMTWLSNETLATFSRNTQCFIQHYSKYCYKEIKQCVRGEASIRDNIADVEGIKVGYMAYKFASQLLPEEPALPGMEKYSWDQVFFMTAARQWCSTDRQAPGALERAHSPPKVRVETSMINFPSFAKAFKCVVGSKYAPIKTCSVWGNYWE